MAGADEPRTEDEGEGEGEAADEGASAIRDPYLDPDEFEVGAAQAPSAPHPPRRRHPLLLPGLAALVVGTFLGFWVASWPGTAHPQVTRSPTVPTVSATPLDAQRVKDLTAKATAEPANTAVRKELAELYAASLDWKKAQKWQSSVVKLAPKDTDAGLVLGVYAYNNADLAGAKRAWNAVLKANPNSQEALYDLGFAALAEDPPDEAEAIRYWERAAALNPSSATGQRASHQLDALRLSQSSPSAAPSGHPLISPTATPS